jgi:hypothetical protein
VPAERTLLEWLIPRRSTLRSDWRTGNRAASASRSPFLIECQGTERSFNAPPHPQDSVGVYMNCQVSARLVLRRNCFGVVGPTRASVDSAALTPNIGPSDPRNRLLLDTSRSCESEDENRRSGVSVAAGMRDLPENVRSSRRDRDRLGEYGRREALCDNASDAMPPVTGLRHSGRPGRVQPRGTEPPHGRHRR